MFISILYMFQAAMCPSSEELLYQCDTCFLSLCVDDRLACRLTCIRVADFSLQHGYHSNPTTPKLQNTSNQEQYDQCGNSTEKSQAPDDGYINDRNMLST